MCAPGVLQATRDLSITLCKSIANLKYFQQHDIINNIRVVAAKVSRMASILSGREKKKITLSNLSQFDKSPLREQPGWQTDGG
jgi:hypothetical protein